MDENTTQTNNTSETEESLDEVKFESYNDDLAEDGEITPEERIKTLRAKLKACSKERMEYLDGWQRLKADFVNYKKREEESKADFTKYAQEAVITDILPTLESFQMAFANKEAWEKVDSSWRVGVEYISTNLTQVLSGYGLSEVNPIGEEFNPTLYTSIGTVVTDDKAKVNKVAEVLQRGYRLHGKLIKSPRVKVYGESEAAA